MDNRRDFIKKAALLSGAAGFATLPAAVQRALAINPALGTTYLDAEHVVFLMQENRSFDHCYGALQGVRGFNDPRAIRLPNKNTVWLQSNAAGETYAPFRLDIKNSRITWMGSLPHSWSNQVDARNNGKYDKWLEAKKAGHPEFAKMPLTMGHYTRQDLPFYYGLADAFTVCDQHFCSSLTGTTPNRLYFWSGTIRAQQNENSPALVWNEEADYGSMVSWKTYPERLEENGVSWKIYQNDVSAGGGFTSEEDAWLANFTDNPIEFFSQYNVRLSDKYLRYLENATTKIPGEISALEQQLAAVPATDKRHDGLQRQLDRKKAEWKTVQSEQKIYTREKYEQLTPYQKNLHNKAFSTNVGDEFFNQLTTLKYNDGNTAREVNVPKGDILHRFREDVKTGALPTVSWIVAPENFSDHPGAAWYGAWYVSEVMDILTQNPEVWKKTIFVLTYDENDGYFDHVPPFVAPNPQDPGSGKASAGIDTSAEFVNKAQEARRTWQNEQHKRESSIGLGYRVPLVIASPWSRGGWVNSQVFDHTSALQFLEHFLQHKTGKAITETNITDWRRTVCGDLSSVFRPYNGEKINTPEYLEKDAFLESIHKAQFKGLPAGFKQLTAAEIAQINKNPAMAPQLPQQEKGIRHANALPYELYVDGQLQDDQFNIHFAASQAVFGQQAAGAPFLVYAPGKFKGEDMRVWSYGVAANADLGDSWRLADFENGQYHLQVHGPNGFFREFMGAANSPQLQVACKYQQAAGKAQLSGNIQLELKNNGKETITIQLSDNAYKTAARAQVLAAGETKSMVLELSKSHGWYDCSVRVKGNDVFEQRYAGRVETGKPSFTDPLMGRV
ncbi:phospholipase C, phosphocholine-specific [Chitinophaga agrisoli]|uniref:phospholipase C n=1 Tax=Chitinophaga agrisoli TaxID=2607653 RepID=A0A5B2VLY3_9BACT|nr:phospholipase C, phosphocholine-specific [Chitinophaga agrisoli]KAA2239332.1 phospholipase C, phosphocholine-specific [Chitinophaga agrisoli]